MGFRVIDRLLPFAGALLVVLFVAFRLRPDLPWLRRAVSGGSAVAGALIATEALKFAIGRSQVWPQFLQDGIYALRPFQLDRGFMSFPSGTMAGTTAFVTGLHLRRALERFLAGAVIAFFAVVLLVASGHWVSDILGGTILGLVVGRVIARRFYRET